MIPCAVLFLIFSSCFMYIQGVPRNTVTNEDIRDAILQVVKVVKTTEDKLERHEYRERILGDSLKKGLMIIEKRIKVLDPLKGAFNRLDERLAAVESVLLQKDERERIQLQKTYDTVDDIHKNLPILLEKLKDDILEKINSNEPPAQITEPTVSKKDFEKLERDLIDKVEKVSKTINGMEKELGRIRDDNRGIRDINNRSSENLDKVKRQLNTSEELLQKYESKLSEYNKVPTIDPRSNFKEENEWQTNFLNALQQQKDQVSRIVKDVQSINRQVSSLPDKMDVQTLRNTTLEKLDELKQLSSKPSDVPKDLSEILAHIREDLDKNKKELNDTLTDIADVTNGLANGIPTSYDQIRNDIQALSRLEQVMMQTADNVLDTKRRIEYGVHQIMADSGKKIKDSGKDIIDSVNERFDNFESSVLDEETGALANLTSKIGEEIDQVWRQIGIMHQQMTASTDTLNKLQNQTDSYVNGSLNVMDNMKGKVGQITGRMAEVDDNLNYLLGRLSLVTQEFNQIKSGLGKALDEIRGSFQTVQDKIKDAGPGPHNITSNEVVSS